jgi:heptosyltransferase III
MSMPKSFTFSHAQSKLLSGPGTGTTKPGNPSRKKVLFITNTRLGDAVLTTGLLAKAVERCWPCDVTIACGPTPAHLFVGVPGLQRIIILDKKEKGIEWLRLWKYAAQFYWDLIVDVRNSFVSYLVFRKKVFRYTKIETTQHKCAQLAKAMKLAEVPYNHIWLPAATQKKAREMLPEGSPILALCPTSGWWPKTWPLDRFIELAKRLPFKRAAIFCAGHEHEQIMPIIAALRDKLEVIDLSKTDPLEAAACLALCSICVANDSGLMHVSAAVGTPTLGIFGPTNDVVYGAHGPHTAVIRDAPFRQKTRDPGLMLAVNVDSVVEAVKKLMDRCMLSSSGRNVT